MEKVILYGRTKLENISKLIGEDAEKMLKNYIVQNPSSKDVVIEYDSGVRVLLSLQEDEWIRYEYE